MRVPRSGAGSQVSRVSAFRRVLHGRATLVRPVHLRRQLRLAREHTRPSKRHVAGSWRSPWKTASTLFPSGSITNAA